MSRGSGLVMLLLSAALLYPGTVAAQDTIPATQDTLRRRPPMMRPVVDSAGAARLGRPGLAGSFLRSVVVPGWGQAEYDAYFRGGVYFSMAGTNLFMLFRSFKRVEMANQKRGIRFSRVRAALEEEAAMDSALAARLADPRLAEELILQRDTLAADLDGLVESRKQQREDWIAWTIFWALASGVDALVTAHLFDFPQAISAEPTGDGVRLEMRLPIGPDPRRPR